MRDFIELSSQIIKFKEERNWEQFHTLKDLLLGLNIEVSELQELFLWKTTSQINEVKQQDIEDELADIFIFITYIANHFDVDLLQAIESKIAQNSKKYPIEKCFGKNNKYTDYK